MILFVGSEDKGFFAEEVIQTIEQKITYSGLIPQIEKAKEKMIEQKYDYIIVDIEQFVDPPNQIAETLATVKMVAAVTVIILAAGYQNNAQLLQALAQYEITQIISAVSISKQREQLKKCIDGEINIQTQSPDILAHSEKSLPSRNFKTISFGGACRRIGTTTQAMQFIKYLNFNGYSACYIQMNNNKFVEQLAQVYTDTQIDKDIGRVTYQNIDMFYQKEKIADILKMPFDYFVYDFGSFDDKGFNAISFLEKDIAVMVCGAAPNEWEQTNTALFNIIMTDVHYIFSFCDEAEHADLLDLMGEKANKTVFADFCPDFFTFTANRNKLYEPILALKNLNGSKSAKKGLFHSKRRS